MPEMLDRAGLSVAPQLVSFVEEQVLPPLGVDPGIWWQGVADLFALLAPENRALLARRDVLQEQIDLALRRGRRSRRGLPAPDRLSRARAGALHHRHHQCRSRDRDHGGAATRRASAQCPVCPECRQCALGQPVRRAVRYRCAAGHGGARRLRPGARGAGDRLCQGVPRPGGAAGGRELGGLARRYARPGRPGAACRPQEGVAAAEAQRPAYRGGDRPGFRDRWPGPGRHCRRHPRIRDHHDRRSRGSRSRRSMPRTRSRPMPTGSG